MPPADRRLFPDWNEPRPRACAWGPPPGRLRRWLEPPSSRAQSRPTRQASPTRLTGFPPLGLRSGWRQVYATQGAAACEQVVVARPASHGRAPSAPHGHGDAVTAKRFFCLCPTTHTHTHLLSVPPDNQHEAPWLWTPPAITDSPDQRTEKQTPSGSGQAAETIAAMATDGVPLLRRPCVPPPLACRHHPLRDGNLTCFNVFPVSSHFFPSFFSQSA